MVPFVEAACALTVPANIFRFRRAFSRWFVTCGLALAGLLPCAPALANDGDMLVERIRFMNAVRLLNNNSEAEFLSELDQLQSYPLHHYLQYRWLAYKIDSDRDELEAAILDYAKVYSWSHLSRQLMGKWQRHLFQKARWREFINVSKHPLSNEYACRLTAARLHAGDLSPSLDVLLQIWLEQALSSSTCNSAAALVLETITPTSKSIWDRVARAMESGRWRVARKMGAYLGESDGAQLELWIDSYRNPGDNADNPKLADDNPFNRRVVAQQHRRWSRFAAEAADGHWQKIRQRYAFTPEQRLDVDRQIALATAQQHLPQASARLSALEQDDETVQLWRLRVSLRAERWDEVLTGLDEISEQERADPRWRYWRARALAGLGRASEAKVIYRELASDANYYGFLAADRLGNDYKISASPLPEDAEVQRDVAKREDVIRAREYFLTGLRVDARRAWERSLNDVGESELVALARLADQWMWHDRAIFTISKTDFTRDYSLRFPMPYTDKVLAVARREAIDPAWMFGLIRRESAFIADIRSSAGAVGLMQLLPSTAKYVARKMGRKFNSGDLTDGSVSISLGAHYLRRLLDRYDGQIPVATAAYNAGPNRVAKWLPVDRKIPADIWVDTLPLSETRNYVRAVMAYATIYSWRMQQSATPLQKRMQIVASVE